MARVISDDCISCGACADTCPVSAISEGDGKYVVNADECIDCGVRRRLPRWRDLRSVKTHHDQS